MIQLTEQDHARIVADLDAMKIPPAKSLAERVEMMSAALEAAQEDVFALERKVSLLQLQAHRQPSAAGKGNE